MNKYDDWNEVKKTITVKEKLVSFKTRDIFWTHIGQNVGYETFGKGEEFVRPVLIFKKFSRNTFLGIPLTTSSKNDKFHYRFMLSSNSKTNYASLSQVKIFDAKRLDDKLGKMSVEDFNCLKTMLKELLEI